MATILYFECFFMLGNFSHRDNWRLDWGYLKVRPSLVNFAMSVSLVYFLSSTFFQYFISYVLSLLPIYLLYGSYDVIWILWLLIYIMRKALYLSLRKDKMMVA